MISLLVHEHVIAEQRKILIKSMMTKRTPKAIQSHVNHVLSAAVRRLLEAEQYAALELAADPGWATKTDVEVVTASSSGVSNNSSFERSPPFTSSPVKIKQLFLLTLLCVFC